MFIGQFASIQKEFITDLGLRGKVVVCMSSAFCFGKGIATELACKSVKVVISTSEAFKLDLDQTTVDIEKETVNRPYAYIYSVLNSSITAIINKVLRVSTASTAS